MPHHINSIERVQLEARGAARCYSDVNDACPYPFASRLGRIYRHAFMAERELLQRTAATTSKAQS